MPKTRNQAIDEYFNGPDWSIEDDITLMNYLRIHATPYRSLSSMSLFDEVVKEVHISLDRLLPNGVSLLDVKLRITALKSRFYEFKEYIELPGVHFNEQNLTVTVDPNHYVEPQHVGQTRYTYKENITRRWFRNNGFPLYNDCMEVFVHKKAAPVDFTGFPGYGHMQPFYIDDSDGEGGTEVEEDKESEQGGVDEHGASSSRGF